MTTDEAREYIVIVNGGSGVLFHPADPESTYILTAKHNIDEHGLEDTDIVRFKKDGDSFHEEIIEIETLYIGENYFPHDTKDIAIIKVSKIDGLDNVFRLEDIESTEKIFRLLGYPEKRRQDQPTNKLSWFRMDEQLSIHGSRDNGRREGRLANREDYNEIVGHSGGGIVKFCNDKLFVAGIQNAMVSQIEDLGAIEFTPVKFFDEIVSKYSGALKPLNPPYLECFSFLEEDCFEIKKCLKSQKTVNSLSNILKNKTKNVIDSKITPVAIKEYLMEHLFVLDGPKMKVIGEKNIWIVWLELLTVLKIAKNEDVSLDKLDTLLSAYRVFYSDTDDDFWVEHIHDLPKADYSDLKKGGTVIVASNVPASSGGHTLTLDYIPEDIYASNKENFDEFHIDNPQEFPFDKFQYLNISAFKEGIAKEQYELFKDLDTQAKFEKLSELYGELINV